MKYGKQLKKNKTNADFIKKVQKMEKIFLLSRQSKTRRHKFLIPTMEDVYH